MGRGKGFRIVAVVLFVVAYLVIHRMVVMRREPSMALPRLEERCHFGLILYSPDVQGHLVRLVTCAVGQCC